MNQPKIMWCCILAVGVALTGACSKRESEPPADSKTPTTLEKPATPPKTTTTKAPTSMPKTTQSGSTKSPIAPPKTSATPQKASSLEKAYHEAPDVRQKTDIVYRLGDMGSPEAILALGRIFETEGDAELKENLLTALWVVDGYDKEKIPIYAMAVQANQPEEVRKEAIDGLGDLEVVEAIPVLQSLINDPNKEISEAAKDAIETVRSSLSDN
jgi:hypothetical protein